MRKPCTSRGVSRGIKCRCWLSDLNIALRQCEPASGIAINSRLRISRDNVTDLAKV